MKTISKRQRSMLPRTAFVLIVIGIAYITIPDKLSFSLRHSSAFSSKEDDLSFSTRQLLQAENSDETITDNSESDSRYSLRFDFFKVLLIYKFPKLCVSVCMYICYLLCQFSSDFDKV